MGERVVAGRVRRLYRALRWWAQERRTLREVARGDSVVLQEPGEIGRWLRE